MKFSFSQTSLAEISQNQSLHRNSAKISVFSVSLIVALKLRSFSENVGMTVVTCLLCLLQDWMRVKSSIFAL